MRYSRRYCQESATGAIEPDSVLFRRFLARLLFLRGGGAMMRRGEETSGPSRRRDHPQMTQMSAKRPERFLSDHLWPSATSAAI